MMAKALSAGFQLGALSRSTRWRRAIRNDCAQLSQVLDASDLPSTGVVEHVEAAPERPADLRELVRQEC